MNSGFANINDASNTRNNIDFNVSNTYSKNSFIKQINWSYLSKGTIFTPNYIGVHSNIKKDFIESYITLTNNSDKFKPTSFMKEFVINKSGLLNYKNT